MPSIIIIASQYDNLGDLIINKCLAEEVAKYDEVYLELKNVPQYFKEQLQINERINDLSTLSGYSLKGPSLFLFMLKNTIKFNFLFKSPGPFGNISNFKNLANSIGILAIYNYFKNRKSRPQIIGNDLIISSKIDKLIFKLFSKTVDEVRVRSLHNIELLANNGITNVKYLPDLCFLIHDKIILNPQDQRNKVGISFREIKDKFNLEATLNSIEIYINLFISKGYIIEFFYQVKRDKIFNKYIFERFNKYREVTFNNTILTIEKITNYQRYFSVLSNRLHVLLMAQLHGSIPIAVINDNVKTNKIKRVFESIGLPELVFPFLEEQSIEYIYKNSRQYLKKIAKVNKQEYNQLSSYFKALFENPY